MWATKFLISPVKKGFLPKNDQIWHFWSIWAWPCRLIWCPVGGSIGGCGPQALYLFTLFENAPQHHFDISMPLKMHIIVHHYRDYFEQRRETLLKYTDEFTESMHSQLRQFEESHHYKNLKFECESHAEAQNKSIVHINSLNID